ncbi:sensor histidine kinase [Rhizomicrobium electricum]|uniref:histidine kinase n=1 Tax=Rhizomicrobium electricum TaxID=480070 RepID=A0ABN1E1C2_9PROT|nr:ATP-binding protein [Rhizomicrobium electricum]NIJ47294.1 two-component system cell cycle sensor histidine kinase PleC [Rhizomicrobium electricum]
MSSFGGVHASKPDIDAAWTAGRIAVGLPPISEDATCAEVYEMLHAPGAPRAAAVVDYDGRVLGLINRLRFLSKYAQRFIPELYGRRSIMALANPYALVLDENMRVSEVAATITEDHPDALRECFVITQGGKYLGIGTSEELVKAKMALLAAREEQLNAAMVAADDADRTRSNFLALMSHELRTPLNAIIGFSEVIAGEMFGPHSVKRYGDYANDILGAGRHLLALINDILDLSKIDAGHLELHSEPVDLCALLQDAVKFLAGRAADGKVRLCLAMPDELPPVRADALRLKQVLLNLLSNAVKFTLPDGTVTIGACVAANGGVEISVADTGIGMAPDEIPIALEPFRQVSSPHARNVEGTGLGLSLAKALTERHGGTLSIESKRDVGTTVRIHLPPGRTIAADSTAAA